MQERRHYQVIDPYNRRITLKYKEKTLAVTTNALILKEVGKGVYDPVFYIPKEDIRLPLVPEPERSSNCPIKGEASYWHIDHEKTDNYFAWSYDAPLPRSKKIKEHVAFNMEYITFISEPII